MAEIIDTRNSDGYLVVLGSAVTLPNSSSDPSQTTPPFRGSLRYNPNTQTVQLYISSWADLGSGGGGGGGLETVTLTGDATGVTNQNGTIPVVLATVATAGTYSNISIDAKGRVVKSRALNASDISTALTYTPANIASPAFTGTPTAPTPSSTDNSTKVATTAYVQSNIFKTILYSGTTYYVSSSGSDSNPGTQSSPYATVTHAYTVLVNRVNLNGNNVTIQIENGTYTESIVISGVPEGLGQNSITIVGNNATPTDVSFNSTNSTFSVVNGANVHLTGISMSSTGGNCIFLQNNAAITFGSVNFGNCADFHIQGGGTGSYIFINAPYTISNGAQAHCLVGGSGEIVYYTTANPISVALSGGGTMNFPQGFAVALSSANINVFPGVTFNVAQNTTVNAVKSVAKLNGVINTNNQGGSAYFPGNQAGTSSTGGQYA